MTTPIRIAIAGARGHMGRAVIELAGQDPTLAVVARIARAGSAAADGQVELTAALAQADVVIDFTRGAASAALASACAARGGPALVIGSTGFEDEDLAAIAAAARYIPIVRSGNFSLGLNLLLGMVARVAKALPQQEWDIEIVEAHHRRKVDAPSGTALMLGEAAAQGRGVALEAVAQRGRDGITGARPPGEIGFAVLRAGGIVGEHSVMFAAEDEILTLSHSARDRSMFARGALAAARWVVHRQPGEYDMQDVLGLGAPG